ncbi:MAG: nucleotide exchange factor GrpE [Bacteroidaceae bacterium]|nr:nucleotide exchange factor GrpE [Bacteroidaceae bacterium]
MKEKEDIKNKAEEAVEEETQSVDNTTEIPVEDGKSELEKANEKIAELEDKYLRQVAEFDNYRRRVMKEKAELILNGGEKVLTEILPIVDDLERAEQQMEQMTDVDAVKQGVELIIDKFIKFLRSQGVQEIDTKDKDFDVNYHEAITMVPSQSDDQKGKVIDCVTKGYTLNDKVIRYAKVVVAN